MMIRPVLSVLFFFGMSLPLWSTVRTSVNSGPWETVAWNPSGPPQPGDTIVVTSRVWNMPPGLHGKIVIWPGGMLTAPPGVYHVQDLVVNGELRLLAGAVMKVNGSLSCDGLVGDAGAVEMVADGAFISGGGTVSNLMLNAGAGSTIRAGSDLHLRTLYVATGGLRIDSHDVTIDGDFTSNAPYAGWGIVATTGLIELNGPVHGSASGRVVLGWVTGGGTPKHPKPPSTHGRLGRIGDTVRFAASRHVSYCDLLGTASIDSGATALQEGIGASGVSTIYGSLVNDGTLTAADDRYHWRIEGDLINRGLVDHCTVLMTGHSVQLRTDSGTWGYDAGLKYRAASSARLELHGSMTLPLLEIGALSPLDAGVVVDAGTNEILVRHRFASDRARNCRLVSDTLVRLRNHADGVVLGDVAFEGFYDSEITGLFGGLGRVVTQTMPKRFAGAVVIVGSFSQTPNARLTVLSTTAVPPGTVFSAEVIVDTGGAVVVDGNLTVIRGMRGGGRLEMIGSGPTLDARAPFQDSMLVQVGRDTIITHLTVARSFALPRMTIYPDSRLVYPSGVTADVAGEFRYRLAVPSGFSMLSAALRPSDPAPAAVFPGADSVYLLNDSLDYVAVDSIEVGRGYWVHFPDGTIIEQIGTIANPPLANEVHDDWNIVGGASVPVNAGDIAELLTTSTSAFFEFMVTDPTDGYGETTVLLPGRGYLVRYDGPGWIVRQ